MKEISIIQKHISDYRRTQKTYVAYLKAGYYKKYLAAPTGLRRLLVIILVFLFLFGVIAVNIALLFRSFPCADVLIDLRYGLFWEALTKMHHHGCVKQLRSLETLKPQEVLHIWVFLYRQNRTLVR